MGGAGGGGRADGAVTPCHHLELRLHLHSDSSGGGGLKSRKFHCAGIPAS